MASAYALPLDSGTHVHNHHAHAHAHSRSFNSSLRPERTAWLSQINEVAGTRSPSPNTHSHSHSHSESAIPSPHEPGYNDTTLAMGPDSTANGGDHSGSHLAHSHHESRLANGAFGRSETTMTSEYVVLHFLAMHFGFANSIYNRPLLDVREALTAVLIPLPYLFASLAYPTPTSTSGLTPNTPYDRLLDAAPGTKQDAISNEGSPSALLQACCLTSGTLLLAGLIGGLNPSEEALDRRKAGFGRNSAEKEGGLLGKSSLRRIAARIVSIGLPYYAAMQLGGARTSFVLLTTLGSGLTGLNINPLHPNWLQAWKSTASIRRLTCAVLLLSFMLDLSGLARGIGTRDLVLGHISLALAVLFFPPPLATTGWSPLNTPQSVSSMSALQTPYDTPKVATRASLPDPSSPLVASKDDVKLTLIAGAVMSIATVGYASFASTSPSLSYASIVFTTLSMSSALGLLFLSLPSSLRSSRKLGVALGYAVTISFGYLLHSDAWKGFMALGVLSCLAYMAVLYDTVPSMQSVKDDHQHHDHGHKHSHKHQDHQHYHESSSVSKYIITLCKPGSVMHSILVEKDSRRIAYFGW